MAIGYTVATNVIQVTGYSVGTPANFTDVYNADKAGTLSLHARTGIAGTDGAAVATDRAERPADYVILGGASNDLYITAANWNGLATGNVIIRITGTDRDGVAQTEDIVLNGNGNYYTTKWFKTITHTQVTSFGDMTSFDYDLTQGQWGVSWKQSSVQFLFDAEITIGDGSTSTYFHDINKQITFSNASNDYYIRLTTNAKVWFGDLVDSTLKTTKNGCQFIFLKSSWHRNMYCVIYTANTYLHLFGCLIYQVAGRVQTSGKTYNCIFTGEHIMVADSASDTYNIQVQNTEFGIESSKGTFEKLTFTDCTYGIYIWSSSYVYDIKNAILHNCTYELNVRDMNVDWNLINVDSDKAWAIYWNTDHPSTGRALRRYEFDLKVTDKDGVNIPDGATVKIWDKDDTLIVDTTTTSGVIATQTITRGYYNQANLNTLQDASPHTMEIKLAGYQTYTKVFTLYKAIDWEKRLRQITEVNLSKRARVSY